MLIEMIDPEFEKSLYNQISKTEKLRFVVESIIKPSEKDYKLGIINRYFFRQKNNSKSKIIEVDRKQWNSFNGNSFYLSVSLKWRLTGSKEHVISSNLKSILESDKILSGIKLKLENNLLQFYRD